MNWIKNKILSFVQKTKDRFKKEPQKKNKKKVFGLIVLSAIKCN